MATPTTVVATGNLSQDKVDFFIKEALEEHGKNTYRFRAALANDTIPSGNGTNIKFVRIPRIVLPGTLTEGVPPTSDAMDAEIVTATATQFGQSLSISDVVDLTLKHPFVQRGMMELAEAAARKDDQIIQDVLLGGTNVFFGGGKASRALLASGDIVDTDLIRDSVAQLEIGSDGVDGSAPRMPNGTYAGIFHSKHILDLLADTDFRNLAYRQDAEALRRGVVNTWNDVQITKNTFGPQFTNESAMVGAAVADAPGGTTYDIAKTIKFSVVQKNKKRGFAEGILESSHLMVANKDLLITVGTSTDFLYDVYADSAADGTGTRKLVIANVVGTTAVTVSALPTGAAPPLAPAAGVTVYVSYILGARSASVVDLKSLQTFTNQGPSKSDPLDQQTIMGTKWFDTAVILNDAFMVRLEAPSNH